MLYTISPPEHLATSLRLPTSKSLSNRALCISALTPGAPQPIGIAECDDTDAMQAALNSLTGEKNIQAAGTAMRFLTAYFAATQGADVILTGSERMQKRPIKPLVDALQKLGASITYTGNAGFPPLHIHGTPLRGGEVCLPGNISSQYVSALLMIAPTMSKGLKLTLTGTILSRPYIDMTLQIMQTYGAKARWTDTNTLQVLPGPYLPVTYTIEGDWSAASYWYEAVALSPSAAATVTLLGLQQNSLQGDSRVARLFRPLGVQTTYLNDAVRLTKAPITTQTYNANLQGQPDLAQTLIATCIALPLPFQISGLDNLRIKETDRIAALIAESAKLGAQITEPSPGTLTLHSSIPAPPSLPIETYNDHRMAMAFAPVCLRTSSIQINNPSVVTKSYPTFWSHLRQAGFTITDKQP